MNNQSLSLTSRKLLVKHVAVPAEHGAWVFLFSPLIIGSVASGAFSAATAVIWIAALAGFLIRQPITILVKIFSKRRPKTDLMAALFWLGVYGFIGGVSVAFLIAYGHGYILYLLVPALPVFGWHLWLVSRRAERKQAGVEIVAGGVLALAAPAAFWVGRGNYDPVGWLLWSLLWLQAAVSIVYAYLRLEQRVWKQVPSFGERVKSGSRAFLYVSLALGGVIILSILRWTSPLLPIAFLVQWLETIYGIYRPAVGVKPTAVGIRQLIVSGIFTLVFLFVW